MLSRSRRLLCVSLLFAVVGATTRPASGQVMPAVAPQATSELPQTVWPSGWGHRTDWLLLGGVAVSGLFLDPLLREEIHTEAEAPFGALSRVGGFLGDPAIMFSSLGLTYGIGKIAGQPALADGALRAGSAILAAGLVTEGLKVVVGRGRPYAVAPDRDAMRPGSLSADYQSFPSGHTTVAFALATAVAWNSESRWVPLAAYSGAALVGLSRLQRDVHWGSDVLAGALVGIVSARLTLTWLDRRGNAKVEVLPSPTGLSLSIPVR